MARALRLGLRAPTPRVLRSGGAVEEGATTRPTRSARRRVVTTGRRDGHLLRGAGRVGLLGRVVGPHSV